jgi:hypothetical protein
MPENIVKNIVIRGSNGHEKRLLSYSSEDGGHPILLPAFLLYN